MKANHSNARILKYCNCHIQTFRVFSVHCETTPYYDTLPVLATVMLVLHLFLFAPKTTHMVLINKARVQLHTIKLIHYVRGDVMHGIHNGDSMET